MRNLHLERNTSIRFVLQDLGNADLSKDMYIVCHVMRVGKMLYSESSKKTDKNGPAQQQVFKRPIGVAVQNMGDLVTSNKEGSESEEREYTMKVELSWKTKPLTYNELFSRFRFFKRKKRTSTNSTSS